MMLKTCPKCRTWLSEDMDTFFCTECDYEEFKRYEPKWKMED